uniref:Putative basic tail protein n=1 Tax=Ixodes ricinus TaxID=34613 RepID=A0A0K8RGY2_IXORI
MLPATFLGVFIACFAGEITCELLHQFTKNCNDNEFHEPGYAPGCMYPCTTGYEGESNIQMKAYRNATVCVEFEDSGDTKLVHIGACFNGICTDHRTRCPGCTESDLEKRWSRLPELAGEFHRCPDRNQSTPVESCLYICKDIYEEVGKEGYFYGIYEDGSRCTSADGEEGTCTSGWCYKK